MVSIIVPVYNVYEWLKQCIQSLVTQTYNAIEIILVDDGSTDKSGILCDEWALKDNRIRVIHKNNGGLSDARNVGLEMAKGEYITFIDSDDYVLPTFIEYLYDLISINNADMSVCQLISVDENNNILSKGGNSIDKVVKGNYNCMKEYLSGTAIDTVAWRKLYKKDLFKSGIRYPVGKYHEDVWTTYRLISQCNTIAIGSKALYAYRQRNGSIVNSSFSPKHMDAVYGAIQRQEFIDKKYPNLKDLSAVGIVYASNICIMKMAKAHTNNIESYLNYLQPLYRKYLKTYLKSDVRFASKLFAFFSSCNLNVFTFILKIIC